MRQANRLLDMSLSEPNSVGLRSNMGSIFDQRYALG